MVKILYGTNKLPKIHVKQCVILCMLFVRLKVKFKIIQTRPNNILYSKKPAHKNNCNGKTSNVLLLGCLHTITPVVNKHTNTIALVLHS